MQKIQKLNVKIQWGRNFLVTLMPCYTKFDLNHGKLNFNPNEVRFKPQEVRFKASKVRFPSQMASNMFKLKIGPNLVVFDFCFDFLKLDLTQVKFPFNMADNMFKLKIGGNLVVFGCCFESLTVEQWQFLWFLVMATIQNGQQYVMVEDWLKLRSFFSFKWSYGFWIQELISQMGSLNLALESYAVSFGLSGNYKYAIKHPLNPLWWLKALGEVRLHKKFNIEM